MPTHSPRSLFIADAPTLTMRLGAFLALVVTCCCTAALGYRDANASEACQAGFGKVDITPTEPLRLSGYGSRAEVHTGVRDPLHARAMVLSPADLGDEHAFVLVSVDSILVTSEMTVEISKWLMREYSIPRSQLAMSSTHSHAAPHISGGLINLFRQPQSDSQREATDRYTRLVLAAIRKSIRTAMDARKPATVAIGQGSANFAVNRRLIRDGKWTGFGVQDGGSVDHRVRLMQVSSAEGNLLGAAFMYACHCTTLGGDFNEVSSDWAGLAALRLERLHTDAVFLPIIGCGADANPEPRGAYASAQKHAAELVDSIESILNGKGLQRLGQFPIAQFGYAGLAPEQPTDQHIAEMAASTRSDEVRWAEHMKATKQRMGRLPETYPMPIHTWTFGNDLCWVFLGGEVVSEYQFGIEKELPTKLTWVAAYTDDVFAYVASERMRQEAGYEVDFSMIYYMQPGRWQSGTQSLILRRVREIFSGIATEAQPLSAEASVDAIHVPPEYVVELVASEPLVQDPVNIAFGVDGSVWIVEMADYPRGTEGGGRVRRLRDTNHDGKLDQSTLFASGLSYPTSVMPWRDGVIIVAAPNILFARDTDGDGSADSEEILLSGIAEANPQHRANGFELGLDGWLHFSPGDGTKKIVSHRNQEAYTVHGHDLKWQPDSGEIKLTSGETQFVRARDPFGNWFGNSNSRPMYHYAIESRYLNEKRLEGNLYQDLLTPAFAPPVKPASRTAERFNDLFAFERFTSACSSIVCRGPGVDPLAGSGPSLVGLICEPVHNLVARIQIAPDGASYSATRPAEDDTVDFFASTDPFSRPVRAVNAPDGSVWILDMVRKVIEHPEWIPESWQERVNLRDGSQLGRIYRVYRKDFAPTQLRPIGSDAADILPALASENGAIRDLALQKILTGQFDHLAKAVRRIAAEHPSAPVRAGAIGCLAAKDWLNDADLATFLSDTDPRIVRLALSFTEGRETLESDLKQALLEIPSRSLGEQVDFQWLLSSQAWADLPATESLRTIANRASRSSWLLKAISLLDRPADVAGAFTALTSQQPQQIDSANQAASTIDASNFKALKSSITALWKQLPVEQRRRLTAERVAEMVNAQKQAFSTNELILLTLVSQNTSIVAPEKLATLAARMQQQLLNDETPQLQRATMARLIGSGLQDEAQDLQLAAQLLTTDHPELIRATTLEALRSLSSPDVAQLLIDRWDQLNEGSLRAKACATLLARSGSWTNALVDALQAGSISAKELDLSTIERLRTHRDRNVRNRISKLLAQPTERSEVVERYVQEMPAPTANSSGAELYKTHCAVCHQSSENAPPIGPPLENLGHWTIDQWVTSIFDPNRNVEPKYLQSVVLAHSGDVLVGLIVQQDAQQVTLAQSDGTRRTIETSEIDQLKQSRISLMPDGFESRLTPEQVSQIIGFLRFDPTRSHTDAR